MSVTLRRRHVGLIQRLIRRGDERELRLLDTVLVELHTAGISGSAGTRTTRRFTGIVAVGQHQAMVVARCMTGVVVACLIVRCKLLSGHRSSTALIVHVAIVSSAAAAVAVERGVVIVAIHIHVANVGIVGDRVQIVEEGVVIVDRIDVAVAGIGVDGRVVVVSGVAVTAVHRHIVVVIVVATVAATIAHVVDGVEIVVAI